MQNSSDRPIRTYTVGFEDPEYDEAGFARSIAEHPGSGAIQKAYLRRFKAPVRQTTVALPPVECADVSGVAGFVE